MGKMSQKKFFFCNFLKKFCIIFYLYFPANFWQNSGSPGIGQNALHQSDCRILGFFKEARDQVDFMFVVDGRGQASL